MENEKIVGMESIIDLIWAPENDIVDINPANDTFLPGHPGGPGQGPGNGGGPTPPSMIPGPPSLFVGNICR